MENSVCTLQATSRANLTTKQIMTLKSMLLPLAALTGSAAFLFWQHAEQEPIRQQVTLFRETLQAVTSHRSEVKARAEAEAAAHGGANGTSPSGAAKATRADTDLKALAKLMLGMRNGTMLDAKAMLKLQETIQDLEPEELSGLIADAGKLDLPQEQRDGLVMMLIQGLGEKDPKAGVMAAAEFRKSAPHSRFSFSDTMGSAFTAWAKKDLAGAMTWFDGAVAVGQFESKALDDVNREQTRMISRVLKQLWDHDPAAARQRLLALPDKERSAVLGSTEGFEKDAASQKQFSSLVRAILPEKEQINVLNGLAASVYHKGNLESVTQLFATIEATPEERKIFAAGMAASGLQQQAWENGTEKSNLETATTLRTWLAAEDAAAADATLGKSLGFGSFSPNDALALVTELHRAQPSDTLLISFLAQHPKPQSNPEAWQALAGKIIDPAARAAALEKLAAP
jgi:hypothetical protein